MCAMPCCAVLCSAYDNATKHAELARANMYVLEHFIQSSFSIKKKYLLCCTGTYTATNTSTAVVCRSMYVVQPRAQQSTAQHSANPPPQSSTCRSEYASKISIYVYAYCVPLVSLEHGAHGICKSLVCTSNVGPSTLLPGTSVCHSNPCF